MSARGLHRRRGQTKARGARARCRMRPGRCSWRDNLEGELGRRRRCRTLAGSFSYGTAGPRAGPERHERGSGGRETDWLVRHHLSAGAR